MKTLQPLLTIFFCLFFGDARGQANRKLAEKIDSLYAVDQNIQLDFKKAIENKAPSDSIQKMEIMEKATFDRHIPILKKIVTDNGYPTIKLAGAGASHNFFVLIQHADSDPAFQSLLLPVLKKLSFRGEVQKRDYAFLYDRVQRNTGKKQLYGTQLSFDNNGNLFDSANKIIIPQNLAGPSNVDKRRKEMGLEPLERYYESFLQAVDRPRKKA